MKSGRFILYFILLTIAQILVCNFLNFSQYLMISVLPVLIMCLPVQTSSIWAVIIAFITGFAVDFLSTGMLGLSCSALLPVAILRRPIISMVFGREIYAKQEEISLKRHGLIKMTLALLLAISIFLILYIWIDAAGTRPFWFNTLKYFLSLLASFLLSLLLSSMLRP